MDEHTKALAIEHAGRAAKAVADMSDPLVAAWLLEPLRSVILFEMDRLITALGDKHERIDAPSRV